MGDGGSVPGEGKPIDSNILHHRLIKGGETNQPPACHPERSEGSRCPAREILRCAQDDKQALSIPTVFWSPFLGLLKEYVRVNRAGPVNRIRLSYLNANAF